MGSPKNRTSPPPATPKRLRRQGATFFSPGSEKSSPGSSSDSFISEFRKKLSLVSPKTPVNRGGSRKDEMSPMGSSFSSSPASNATTLVMGSLQPKRRTRNRPVSSPGSTSTSPKTPTSSTSTSMKSMKAKVHQQVMKAMKPVKGKGKPVKNDIVLKKNPKKRPIWKPSSDTIIICPKKFYKGWRAYHGQVKMLQNDLGQAWYEHRDLRGYNKSFRCGAEAFKSFFGFLLII